MAACAQAGAGVAHLHVREDDGTPSARSELFVQTVALIREKSDIVTMVSTGGAVWMSMEDRMAGLEAAPDMAGVETGSMNFGEEPFITIPSDARRVVDRAGALGIGLEAEMFDVGHVLQAVRMLERGELPLPLRANLVFGVPGGVDASPEGLDAMLRPLPPGTLLVGDGRRPPPTPAPFTGNTSRSRWNPRRLRGRRLPTAGPPRSLQRGARGRRY